MAKTLGDTVVVEAPKVEMKLAQFTFGVRKRIPTKTIAGAIPKYLKETKKYLESIGISPIGKPFFRFFSINMGTEYDLEVGYLVKQKISSQDGFVSNTLPSGKYATLKYAGKNRGYQGNKALIEWTRANDLEMDRWDSELGDTFACRYEIYISDIDSEPNHKKWIKEVAIMLK